MTVEQVQRKQQASRVGFYLLPGFSMLAYASAIEPLLACNRISGEERYRFMMLGAGTSAQSDSAVVIDTLPVTQAEPALDMLIICGGAPANYGSDQAMLETLSDFASASTRVCGIASGSYLMARAGLLKHKKASVHWFSLAGLREQFPEVYFSTDLFCIDGNRATCRGATSALDMLSMLIAQDQGNEMLEALAQYFVRERLGAAGEAHERQSLNDILRAEQPKLAEAVDLMAANIDEPLSTDDLAQHVAISRRQLERLFRKYLDSVPSRYYQQMRLEHARELVRESPLSLSQIALETGFKTSAHFSTAYRNLYGLTPSEERSLSH